MNEVSLEIKIGVVRGMLQKMFRESSHFSICDFDKLIKLLGIAVPRETYDLLHALHCVNWKDMEPAVRRWVGETIDSLLTEPEHLIANFEPKVLRGQLVMSDTFRALAFDRIQGVAKAISTQKSQEE